MVRRVEPDRRFVPGQHYMFLFVDVRLGTATAPPADGGHLAGSSNYCQPLFPGQHQFRGDTGHHLGGADH